MKSKFTREILAITGITFALTACGGGGGSDFVPTSDPIAITPTNAKQVAYEAYSLTDSGFTDLGVPLLRGTGSVSTSVSDQPTLAGVSSRIARDLMNRNTDNGLIVAGALITENCAGGGTMSYDDTALAGDITYSNCDDGFGTVLDGVISYSGLSFDDLNNPTIISLTLDFNDFSITESGESAVMNGGFNISIEFADVTGDGFEDDSVTISGSRLSVTTAGSSFVMSAFNFNIIDEYTIGRESSTADYTLDSTDLGGIITVVTNSPFVLDYFAETYPHAGQLTVSGANSGLRLTVLSNEFGTTGFQVQVDIDSDGDGAYDDETQSYDWADLST